MIRGGRAASFFATEWILQSVTFRACWLGLYAELPEPEPLDWPVLEPWLEPPFDPPVLVPLPEPLDPACEPPPELPLPPVEPGFLTHVPLYHKKG